MSPCRRPLCSRQEVLKGTALVNHLYYYYAHRQLKLDAMLLYYRSGPLNFDTCGDLCHPIGLFAAKLYWCSSLRIKRETNKSRIGHSSIFIGHLVVSINYFLFKAIIYSLLAKLLTLGLTITSYSISWKPPRCASCSHGHTFYLSRRCLSDGSCCQLDLAGSRHLDRRISRERALLGEMVS